MNSMTGFARNKTELNGREITVELRSVNHRYLDITVKSPRVFAFLDEPVKAEITKSANRGKIEVYIGVKSISGADVAVSLNIPVIEGYLTALKLLEQNYGLKNDLSVMSIARLPDSLGSDREEPDTAEILADVKTVLGVSISDFNKMRQAEGSRLCNDIFERASTIEQLAKVVEDRSPICVDEYRERINKRMTEILGDTEVTHTRIAQEAAIFADKVSVTEEIVRLKSHIIQLKQMLRQNAPNGRKLDFLMQEFNREANTIGSKVNDAALAAVVIELKAEIEKIREQVQNLE